MAEDFPTTLLTFEQRFATEETCRAYLFARRWPEGFVCPRCAGRQAWPTGHHRWVCANCRHQTTVTAGMVFQDTRQPLRRWFRAMGHVTRQKNGASALGRQRVLGLGGDLTAWSWLHQLRRAMVRPGRDRLAGEVEVDETYVGGLAEGPRGRGSQKKALVASAAEKDGQGSGRIRLARIADASAHSLRAFVPARVTPGRLVRTDRWDAYGGLPDWGYGHTASVRRGQGPEAATRQLPRVHRGASLLKRWLLGTHQGAVRPAHLDYYLDEFTFRFNRRTSPSRGKLFYRLVQQAVEVAPAPYKRLRGGNPKPLGQVESIR